MNGCPLLGLPTIDLIKKTANKMSLLTALDDNEAAIQFHPLEERILQIGQKIEVLDEESESDDYFVPNETQETFISEDLISELLFYEIEPVFIPEFKKEQLLCEAIDIEDYKDEEYEPVNIIFNETPEKENHIFDLELKTESLIDVLLEPSKIGNFEVKTFQCDPVKVENCGSNDTSPITPSAFQETKKEKEEPQKSDQEISKVTEEKTTKKETKAQEQPKKEIKSKKEKQKTIEETIGVKSSLFPGKKRTDESSAVEILTKKRGKQKPFDANDISFVVNSDYLDDPQFVEEFHDCRIASRTLYNWDFEISPTECVIIKKSSPGAIASALAVFNCVNVFTIGLCKDVIPMSGVERVKIRQVPDLPSAYKIIKTMCIPQSFVTSGETLHEFFLSLFPCVPRIVAMKWLAKGNPVTDIKVASKNETCGHMLSIVLDSRVYLPKRPTNPSVKRTEAQLPHKKTKIKE